ncbi:MAG: cation:proton antiporter family protein [Pseudomonadales bacterium]|jgi:Kef-type K+ transport system membrane component KefB|nr:cation:proton antiporter family protein [Pseudomonadales bacterium]
MIELIRAEVFYELAALLTLAASIGALGMLLRQPLIVSFIVVGILAGPAVLDIARAHEHIDLLAELGIALLLFLVGLKLDLGLVRTLGTVAVLTGLGQVAFTTIFGFLLCLAFGLEVVTSLYVSVALTFSSTIIIVKLLSDKREIDSLHGRIALGFLIVQDLVVVIAMVTISSLGAGAVGGQESGSMLTTVGAGMGMLVGTGLFIRYAAEPLLIRLGRVPELLMAFAVAWATLLAALGDHFGFGKELGGLLAGVSFASTTLRDAIAARLAPLRDFLLLFFFLSLGGSLDLGLLGGELAPAIALSIFVLIGNPLIVMVIMGLLGYRKRTGFLAGLTVAQISEFSLIFVAMGVSLGQVEESALALVTLVGLVTIAASTYMITWSHTLYRRLEPVLGLFEKRTPKAELGTDTELRDSSSQAADYLVIGLGRYGFAAARALRERGRTVLAVDFDPLAVMEARQSGIRALFGDATDPEFLTHLPLAQTRWVLLAIPQQISIPGRDDPSAVVISALRAAGGPRIAVTALGSSAAERARQLGADLVLEPFRDAALEAADLLERSTVAEPTLELTDPTGQSRLES